MMQAEPIEGSRRPELNPMFLFRWEDTQDAYVLLYPEGVVKLNSTAGEILRRCDGQRTVAAVIDELQHIFAEPPERVASGVRKLAAAGIRVALFIAPDLAQVEAAKRSGAPVIELHTGSYAETTGSAQARELERLASAARRAANLGLEVHAGHGLTYHNVTPVAAIPEIVELNIGHCIIARAIFTGLESAVRDMKQLMKEARA